MVNFVVLLVPIINPYFVHLPWFWLVFSMLLNFCLLILSVWMIVSSKSGFYWLGKAYAIVYSLARLINTIAELWN